MPGPESKTTGPQNAGNDLDNEGKIVGAPKCPSFEAGNGANIQNHESSSTAGRFQFVDISSRDSRREARKHVMQDYIRRRKALASTASRVKRKPRVLPWRNVHDISGEARVSSSIAPSQPSQRIKVPISRYERSLNQPGPSRTNEPQASTAKQEECSGGSVTIENRGRTQGQNELSLVTTKSPKVHSCLLSSVSTTCRLDELPALNYPSPMSPLGAAQFDPFDTYPERLGVNDRGLISHYVSTLPLMMYKMGNLVQYNPMKFIFHQFALQDPVAFECMLALSAKHLASVNDKTDTEQSLRHKTRAIAMMKSRMKEEDFNCDTILYATSTLAVLEKWAKNNEAERMHYNGMVALARSRGGMRGIRATNRFMEGALYWADFTRHPDSSSGGSLPWSGVIPDEHPATLDFLTAHLSLPLTMSEFQVASADATPVEVYDMLIACEQFLAFFHFLNRLHFYRSHADRHLRDLIHSVFNPSTTVYTLLAEEDLQRHDSGVKGIRYINDYAALACLFYINCTLWDYRDQPQRLERYLQWLSSEVKRKGLDVNRSVETLLWMFWRDGKGEGDDFDAPDPLMSPIAAAAATTPPPPPPNHVLAGLNNYKGRMRMDDQGERSWLVSRLMRVAKRLGPRSWDQIREVLLRFLLVPPSSGEREPPPPPPPSSSSPFVGGPSSSSSSSELPWDDDDLRMEILGRMYAGPPPELVVSPAAAAAAAYEYHNMAFSFVQPWPPPPPPPPSHHGNLLWNGG